MSADFIMYIITTTMNVYLVITQVLVLLIIKEISQCIKVIEVLKSWSWPHCEFSFIDID